MNSKSNEQLLVEKFLNFDKSIKEAQEYIKENYHIDSEFDNDTNMFYIWSKNVNESLNLAAANEYLMENIGPEFVDVIYGMKQ